METVTRKSCTKLAKGNEDGKRKTRKGGDWSNMAWQDQIGSGFRNHPDYYEEETRECDRCGHCYEESQMYDLKDELLCINCYNDEKDN